ncbi:MAG: AmmeMemoRadiSam system radical SAM enzyme [Firmicutes bacterium]|nr:AmmeMemoRadiSam system radical SAM enzyme [Bacillota bacterium]
MQEPAQAQAPQQAAAVICELCPHRCVLSPGQWGKCQARVNRGGRLYAAYYQKIAAIQLDPIEKKPLYHFYPGHAILSVGSIGCNLSCRFCQNWEIAHAPAPTETADTGRLLELARASGSLGLAYTYNEPLVGWEFVRDTAGAVREAGMKNVLVSNGTLNPRPWRELLPFLDAVNMDLKGFTERYYREICGGWLGVVRHNAELARQAGVHLELTTLLVPGLNDDPGEIEALARWVAQSLGRRTPLHFSRYFPAYQMNVPPTPLATLLRAWEIGRAYLDYVYVGNAQVYDAAGRPIGSDTDCPHCGEPQVVRREGYDVWSRLVAGRCPRCGESIAISD